jgi:trans-aconitate 2-methyltransferase
MSEGTQTGVLQATTWDPQSYRRFASQRARPFFDLLARVGAERPRLVADLGCGTGELTVSLAQRWPCANVLGVDNSAEMIAAAERELAGVSHVASRLSFARGDVRAWVPDVPPDVITCNAVLQWVPGHHDLVARWARWLAADGWLAFQLPANADQPAYRLLGELMASPRWQPLLGEVDINQQGADPVSYLDLLADAGCAVDAWETTYLHVLDGDDPVLRWYRSTGLRPVLAALDEHGTETFLAEYGGLLRSAYPATAHGTVFPFRRVFVVAHRNQ